MENENQINYVPEKPKKQTNGLGIASFVCGLVAFLGCCNPLYLVSLAAIVLGIVGIATAKEKSKGLAIAGLILGIASAIIWPIIDTVLAVFTAGISYFI